MKDKELLQSLIERETTNSYTEEEREALIKLATDIKKCCDNNTYLLFIFEGIYNYRILLRCNVEEVVDFEQLTIPNQEIIKCEMPDMI